MATYYDYEYFKREILKLTDIDLNCYKERQMKRRLDTLIRNKGLNGYDKFILAMKDQKDLFDEFLSYMTINVSEFYRNPEQWDFLDKKVVPYLIEKFGKRLKIWSAACSTGDEPYSLVMVLSKHMPLLNISILATDLDKQCLEKAKVGLYTEKSIENVPEEFKRKYFTKVGSAYKISDQIKSRVTFQKHDLLKDSYPVDCHLVVCRNVLIYFTEETKEDLFRRFYKCLAPGGTFFIGSTEQIMDYKEIGYQRMNSFFYQK
ncbi:MAG: protein-glutamate O-methyltransferase CheR [Lachnospiraceae bacterium]|nr:protein-glutamate O-methyltransferase CheR [Lachnospiraceae bacterium]MBQ3906803.1 protein-glutamate O-methyltransferase CheR [Lachnospiraceae bacterium]